MTKNRICFYCVATIMGGAERSLVEFLVELQKAGTHNFEVIVPKDSGPLIEELNRWKIKISVIPMPAAFMKTSRSKPLYSLFVAICGLPMLLHYAFKFRNYLLSNKFSHVHTTGIKCHYLALIATCATKIRVVVHLRDIFKKGIARFTLYQLIKSRKKQVDIVANSESTARSFDPKGSTKTRVIYNGVDLVSYPRRQNSRVNLCGKTRIGIVGVLAPWKGQETFLRMAKLIVDHGRVAVKFIVVGDQIYDTRGDKGYSKKLKNLCAELCLQEHVEFIGFQKNIIPIMHSLDILVHASLKPEPFGRVLIEAQACGIPIVASNAGGPTEIIDNGKSGFLVEPGNASAMAEAVEKLITSPEMGELFVLNSMLNLRNKFSLKSHFLELSKILSENEKSDGEERDSQV